MYSTEDSNRDLMIEILPMRHSNSLMSTATKTSHISYASDAETTVENTYCKYEKYLINDNEEVGANPEKLDSNESNDCTEYSDTITLAKNMVKTIKEESEGIFGYSCPTSPSKEKNEFTSCYTEFIANISKENPKFIWPNIKEFTIEEGAVKIDEYLSSFYTEEDWMYVMYYRGVQENSTLSAHKYQVMFSLPTCKYPVAQATASVYFVVELSKLKPANCPVNVLYWYETFRQKHSPNTLNFDEKWLTYILDAKIKLFRQVTY